MRVALLTEGGYPYARGESALWCDRLLRGLVSHEFEVYALSRSARQEDAGWRELPGNVARVRTAPLWGPAPGAGPGREGGAGSYGRRDRRRFAEHFAALAESVCAAEAEDTDGAAGDGAPGRSAADLADRFAAGLYGLAELASERGGLASALRSELAVRILESACRAPGALRAAHAAQVADLLAVTERLERALRPLSLDWYGARGEDPGLAGADLCHAVGGGPAALPGLLARRAFGVPLLITEYGVRLREHYLASAAGAVAPRSAGAPVRALLASFQTRLAREAYAQARLITPGNAHARRWQERCGARPERLRTVYPGMDSAPFDAVGESVAPPPPPEGSRSAQAPTLVWAGRCEPSKDLVTLLHAFASVRETVPGARLRIVETGPRSGGEGAAGEGPVLAAPGSEAPGSAGMGSEAAGSGAPGSAGMGSEAAGSGAARGEAGSEAPGSAGEYLAHCRALAARLFPCEAPDARGEGGNPVSFEELGGPAAPTLAAVYGAAGVVALSSVVEGFPVSLVEAMFCGRATVSTDVGAVYEVIGGTGLVVPPRDPRALAEACAALLRDPARGALLGAAARSRALELFTVEQNTASFRGIYLELMARGPASEDGSDAQRSEGSHGGSGSEGSPGPESPAYAGVALGREDAARPFARPAESHVPGRWAGTARRAAVAAPGAAVSAGAAASPRRDAGRRETGRRTERHRTEQHRQTGAAPGNASATVPSWARGDTPGAPGVSGASGVSGAPATGQSAAVRVAAETGEADAR